MVDKKMRKKKNNFYKRDFDTDDQIFSSNPKDWDAIEGLNMTYIGYYDLPTAYLDFREKLPSKKETTFFMDGMFITVAPGEMPAATYLKYEERKETDPICRTWLKNKEKTFSYNIRRNNWIAENQNANTENLISSVIKEIIPIFLTKLQPKAIKSKHLSRQDLYSAYKKSICNSKEIEKRISFDYFISDINFAINIANWLYAPKIANITKNKYLTEILRTRLYKKIEQYKIWQSKNWYEDYRKYKNKIKFINKNKIYTLKLNNFYQDIDDMKSIESTETFIVLEKDLFNPTSKYYINKLIEAALNKDFASRHLTIQENMEIYKDNNKYKILFSYGFNNKKQNWVFANNERQNYGTASIYSVPDLGFVHIADWHNKLRRAAIQKEGQSR